MRTAFSFPPPKHCTNTTHKLPKSRRSSEPKSSAHCAQGAECSAGDISRRDRQGRPAVHAETCRMREAEEFMEKKIIRAIVALGMGLLFTLGVSSSALAQETQVSGTVTAITGERLPGVTVQVRGTTTTTTTDANGKYTIASPNAAVL